MFLIGAFMKFNSKLLLLVSLCAVTANSSAITDMISYPVTQFVLASLATAGCFTKVEPEVKLFLGIAAAMKFHLAYVVYASKGPSSFNIIRGVYLGLSDLSILVSGGLHLLSYV